MPQIEIWPRIPVAIRDHLTQRMHDRNISLDDLNRLRPWLGYKTECPGWAVVQGFRFVQIVR